MKVSISVTIDGNTGKVNQAAVLESSLGNKRLEDCVLGVIRSLKFESPKDGRAIFAIWPIRFSEK